MKKILYALAAFALVLGACKKNVPDDPTKPSFAWADNAGFAQMEISENMSSVISVDVPNGLNAFTITFRTVPDGFYRVLNQEISIQANKGTSTKPCVYDIVSDGTLAAWLNTEGALSPASNLLNVKSLRLDIGRLLWAKYGDDAHENGDSFTLELYVKDANGNELRKTASFRWTSAPEVSFNGIGAITYLDSDKDFEGASVAIEANGKIDGIILKFEGENADPNIIKYINTSAKVENGVVDLADNSGKAAKGLGLITGTSADFIGKTSFSLNLSSLLFNLCMQSEDSRSTLMTVEVTDQLGKTSSQSVMLVSANLGK